MVATALELGKVYIRLDQPNSSLDVYNKAMEAHPGDTTLVLGAARVYGAHAGRYQTRLFAPHCSFPVV